MRRLLFGFMLCAGMALLAADGVSTNGVRNPFWPMGYEGEREVISPDVRKRPKPAPKARPAITAAERAAREAEKADEGGGLFRRHRTRTPASDTLPSAITPRNAQ